MRGPQVPGLALGGKSQLGAGPQGECPRPAGSRLTWVLWQYSWKASATAPFTWISWVP